MKGIRFRSLRHIVIIVFLLIIGTAAVFVVTTYYSAEKYHLASTQLLNRDVAAHIAKFTSPFEKNGINKKVADSVFHHAMVLSPSIEVYFLDTRGNVMSYYGKDGEIKSSHVELQPVLKYLSANGRLFIKGEDPRDSGTEKIFSAAEVNLNGSLLGYIYVILDSKEFRHASAELYNEHISKLLLNAFLFVIVGSVIITWLYARRVDKRLNNMISILDKFNHGDYNARFASDTNNEFAVFTNSFNRVADLLGENMSDLKRSEKVRKQLIVNISHDLRTPLAVARGYAETLLMGRKEELAEEHCNEYTKLIVQHILQVESMATQLFELSRIDSPEIIAHKQPFVFSEILTEMVHSLAMTASQKSIEIDCEKCEDHSWIFADIKMMESAIQNIILNAIRYTPEQNTILLSTEHETNTVIFKADNPGKPFSDEMLSWLNQESAVSSDLSPNATVGLTIVKRIAALHNYTIEASSANGRNIIRMVMRLYENDSSGKA